MSVTLSARLEQSRHLATALPGPKSRALAARKENIISRGLTPALPTYVARADGGIIEDVDGNRLIDLSAGIAATTVGAANPRVVEAVQRAVADFTHTCFMIAPYEGYIALAEKLDEVVPINGPSRTALFNSGSEANENAVKIARAFTGRTAIAALDHAYHGRTTLTMALTAKSMPYKHSYGPFAPEVYRVPGSYPFRDGLSGEAAAKRTISQLEVQVGASNLAAIIMEPIQGEGGFIVPAPGFLSRIVEWCNANGVLFIADEVQSGFARTGAWFACDHEGIRPDIVTLAKGIGGGMPISAVTGRADVMNCVHDSGLGSTYGGNPVSCAAALAAISSIKEDSLIERAGQFEEIILEHFRTAVQTDPRIGEVRGRGAMIALELVDPSTQEPDAELTADVARRVRAQGVVLLTCGTYGNVIRLLPPLAMSEELLLEALTVLTDALAATK